MRHTIDELRNLTHRHRKRFLELFTRLGYGHITSAFSWAEIATVLYYEIMDLSSNENKENSGDRMVVSKGHGCGILFPIFEDMGWVSKKEMESSLQVGGNKSKINKYFYPGFDFYGGSLGIGLGMAVGLAKGAKLNHEPWKTYCVVGDAECYEGSIWEAIHFAAHQRLDNLIVIVDRNELGVSDFTEHMLRLEPFADKWTASGWSVQEVDGHDIRALFDSMRVAKGACDGKPQCIIAHTKKGKGLSYLVDKPLMHGYMPTNDTDIERAFRELEN